MYNKKNSWIIRDFGLKSYSDIQDQMKNYIIESKEPALWMGEHPLVITMGANASVDDILNHSIKTVRSTRGGLSTLHLPGQLVFYPIFQLKEFSVHYYVRLLEQIVIDYLKLIDIEAFTKNGAPGVYTRNGKIASVGLRVSRGWVYHGLSLNVACTLIAEKYIISCGDPLLKFTSIYEHGFFKSMQDVKKKLTELFLSRAQEVIREHQNS